MNEKGSLWSQVRQEFSDGRSAFLKILAGIGVVALGVGVLVALFIKPADQDRQSDTHTAATQTQPGESGQPAGDAPEKPAEQPTGEAEKPEEQAVLEKGDKPEPQGEIEELDRPDEPGPLHSVWVFKTVCYDPMPDIESVEKMADELGFTPIEGEALEEFAPETETSYLAAWEIPDHERIFKLAIAVSRAEAWVEESFPAFKDGTAISCSVNLPGLDDPKEVGKAVERLTTRAPDETFTAGPLTASFWSSETADNVYLVYHYVPTNGKPGGLLNITTLIK